MITKQKLIKLKEKCSVGNDCPELYSTAFGGGHCSSCLGTGKATITIDDSMKECGSCNTKLSLYSECIICKGKGKIPHEEGDVIEINCPLMSERHMKELEDCKYECIWGKFKLKVLSSKEGKLRVMLG